jgi:hypothetical protein
MFLCFVIINLDLTWKQSFLIQVDNETLWTTFPVPEETKNLHATSSRSNTVNFTFVKPVKTFVLKKNGGSSATGHSGQP